MSAAVKIIDNFDPDPVGLDDVDPVIGACPVWCDQAPHTIQQHDVDRVHMGSPAAVVASLETAHRYVDPAEGNVEFYPVAVGAYLRQHHLQAEALVDVVVRRQDSTCVQLTVDEAEALATLLRDLVDTARGGAS